MAYNPQPAEARKGKRASQSFLAIDCPVCKAPAGKTCMFPPGHFGIGHDLRRLRWARMQQKEKASVA